jgi:hypothetical protein
MRLRGAGSAYDPYTDDLSSFLLNFAVLAHVLSSLEGLQILFANELVISRTMKNPIVIGFFAMSAALDRRKSTFKCLLLEFFQIEGNSVFR